MPYPNKGSPLMNTCDQCAFWDQRDRSPLKECLSMASGSYIMPTGMAGLDGGSIRTAAKFGCVNFLSYIDVPERIHIAESGQFVE